MDLREAAEWKGNRHPWELSRTDSILNLLRAHAAGGTCADIGSGDLYFRDALARLSTGNIHCVDTRYTESTQTGRFYQHRAIDEIAPGSVDVVFLMDVLEHVEDDAALLGKATALLRKGGLLLITVPAHAALFSEHDQFLKHFRRYARKGIRVLVQKAGLEIREDFYFYASLLLGRILQMALGKLRPGKKSMTGIHDWSFGTAHPITAVLRGLLNMDFALNRRLGPASAGLSFCMLCQKK